MNDWKVLATGILDSLLMDPECSGFNISIVGIVPTGSAKSKAATENFVQKFSPIHHQKLKEIGDITSVGLKYIFSREGLAYECHIEPLLTNLSIYFLDMNITAPPSKYEIDLAFNSVLTALAFFKDGWFDLVKNSMLI